jgi:hypothetical protein
MKTDMCAFMVIPRSILFIMRNVLDKSYRENQNTFCTPFIIFFRKSGLLCDNVEICDRCGRVTGDNITWLMRFACWIPRAKDTHPEYVIRIAFPLQEWLRERASNLRLYAHCLSCYKTNTSRPE